MNNEQFTQYLNTQEQFNQVILNQQQSGKRCTKCNIFKPYSEFHKEKQNKDGLRSSCRQCKKEYDAVQKPIYHINNREKRCEKQRQYYSNNKETLSLKAKEYNHRPEVVTQK